MDQDIKRGQSDSSDPSMPDQCKMRLLVVDDQDMIREMIVDFIDTLGKFETYEASNPFEAFNLIEKLGRIDCVLSDINMPGMDGLEFVSRLKKRDRSIEAVIITGYPSMERTIAAMKAGASDFIIKPFSLEQLRQTVEKMYRDRCSFIEGTRLSEEEKARHALESINLKLEKKIHELSVLFNISDELTKAHSKSELYNKIVHLAAALTEHTRVSFWELNRSKNRLELMAALGETLHSGLKEIGIDGEQSPFAQVVNEGVPLILGGEKTSEAHFKAWTNEYHGRSLALVPFTRRGKVYGVMSVAAEEKGKKFDEDSLFLLHLLSDRANLTAENIFLYESLSTSLRSILRALVRSLEAKDPYTKEHSERVAKLALRLASSFGFDADVLDSLSFAAYLHDIGKIGIKDQILTKPKKLDSDEFEIVKLHPIIGEEIVSHLDVEPIVRSCIRNHHERWDGTGYPDGLSGEDIPFLVRVLSIVDCYDALTSKRPYRDRYTEEDAVNEIKKGSGTHFDPKVVEAFVENIYGNKK